MKETNKRHTQLSIRLAKSEDVSHIHRLLCALADDLGKASEIQGTEENLRTYGFSGQSRFQAILAFDGSDAVGLAVFFSEYSTWRGIPGVYVQDLYVAPVARAQGLGRQLLAAVGEHARSWDGQYMKLTVYDRNEEALAFYQRLGFQACEDELPLVLRDL